MVEDQSGRIALEHLLKKILGTNGEVHSWRIHSYKGIGRLPKNLRGVPNPANRLLLDNLPSVLRGYGKGLPDSSAVVVVVDSDDKDCIAFKKELLSVLNVCNPRPKTLFRIAIEEGEAWLLGDRGAIKSAYPNARDAALNDYVQGQHLRYVGGSSRRRAFRRVETAQEVGLPGGWYGEMRLGRRNCAPPRRESKPVKELPGVSRWGKKSCRDKLAFQAQSAGKSYAESD